MKNLSLLILILFFSFTNSQVFDNTKQIYSDPNLKEKIALQKNVAILPFDVKITYRKQPKNFNLEANREQEKTMASTVQSAMYTFLLRKRENYSVTFQDVEKTNVLLRRAGMLEKLDEFTKDEIAAQLGVDAVLGGKFEVEQSKSEAAAIASAVVFGGFGGKTGTSTLTLNVAEAETGDTILRFFKTMNDGIMTSTDDVIERMMRKVSRNFPYLKDDAQE